MIVSSSAAKLDRARALGADHCIDRHRDDWVEAIYAITNDRGCDHVLETVGGSHVGKSVQVAAVPDCRLDLVSPQVGSNVAVTSEGMFGGTALESTAELARWPIGSILVNWLIRPVPGSVGTSGR